MARDGPAFDGSMRATSAQAEAALRERVGRFRRGDGVELRPAGAYEAVTRQMVEALTDELREIRLRLNNLVYMLAGAIVLDVVIRLAGI
jgi:hypothetical protein